MLDFSLASSGAFAWVAGVAQETRRGGLSRVSGQLGWSALGRIRQLGRETRFKTTVPPHLPNQPGLPCQTVWPESLDRPPEAAS